MLLDPTSPIQPIHIDQSKPVLEVGCNFEFGPHETGRIHQVIRTANLFVSSPVTFNGVQMVSANNVEPGSSDEGVKGLAVRAGGYITPGSNNQCGLCNGDDPLILTNQHDRLLLRDRAAGVRLGCASIAAPVRLEIGQCR